MMHALTAIAPAGVLLPASVLGAGWFQVLATFVAINTLIYVTLAVAKSLPRIYPSSWFGGRDRRVQHRGIVPEPPDLEP
jgi:hypothetical protein